jgi:hypothetical protein
MGSFFENYRSGPTFWATFFPQQQAMFFGQKMVWDIFWAIFSQTHLLTLMMTYLNGLKIP